ncbi:MAG: HNH endonuclease [Bacteroidetes bacterium]|nr:HNH endonuclease [Bacteroidota bacterium]
MANFTEEQIQQVWNKGKIDADNDKNIFRKDCCDAWIKRDEYGTQEKYGWEIDHVYPEAKGGTDDEINLRPMHWENNRSKSDDFPDYTSSITSDGNKNIDKQLSKTINDALLEKLKAKYKI